MDSAYLLRAARVAQEVSEREDILSSIVGAFCFQYPGSVRGGGHARVRELGSGTHQRVFYVGAIPHPEEQGELHLALKLRKLGRHRKGQIQGLCGHFQDTFERGSPSVPYFVSGVQAHAIWGLLTEDLTCNKQYLLEEVSSGRLDSEDMAVRTREGNAEEFLIDPNNIIDPSARELGRPYVERALDLSHLVKSI